MTGSQSQLLTRAVWWAGVPLAPVLALQALRVFQRTPRLPDAGGPHHGVVAGNEASSLSLAVLGESTAAGVGVERHSQGLSCHLAGLLRETYGCQVCWQTVGRTGATLRTVHSRLVSRLHGPIDLVIVATGVNDTLRLTSERSFGEQVAKTYRALRSRGVNHVLFSSLPPMDRFPALPRPLGDVLGARSQLLDAVLRSRVAELSHASYAHVRFPSADNHMAGDGFHPGERGYALWAREIARHIQDAKLVPALPLVADGQSEASPL